MILFQGFTFKGKKTSETYPSYKFHEQVRYLKAFKFERLEVLMEKLMHHLS